MPAASGLSGHTRGVLLVALAAIVWSSGGTLARSVETDVWTTIFWRSIFASIFLIAFTAWRNQGRVISVLRSIGWPGVALGLCFATASSCFVVALQFTTVANVLFLQGAAPFIAALLGWLLMSERLPLRTWIAMAAALVGIGTMVFDSFGSGRLIGDLLGFTTAAAFAVATVILRRHSHIEMMPAATLATLFAAAFAALQAAPLSASAVDLSFLAAFGIVQLALGLVLFTNGARLIPAGEATLISLLEVALGPIWVWLIYTETPSQLALVGGGILVGTLVFHSLADWQAMRRTAPPAL